MRTFTRWALLPILAAAAFAFPSASQAHIVPCYKTAKSPKATHACNVKNRHHGETAVAWAKEQRSSVLPRPMRLRIVRDHAWLARTRHDRIERWLAERERQAVIREFGKGVWPAAAAWYARGDTQCEVAHEGGFRSVSPGGKYHGRFQMDSSFEAETKYGAAAQRRWGRASNWPAYVQINHAFEVWSYAGWSRWPPYYKFGCAAYIGRSYPH